MLEKEDVGDLHYKEKIMDGCPKCGKSWGNCSCSVMNEEEDVKQKPRPIVVGVVVNNHNQILSYTCRSSMSQCEEYCEEFFSKKIWDKMKELGCKVVSAKLEILV